MKMKQMTSGLFTTLCACACCCVVGETMDRDSLQYRLSKVFSEVNQTNGNEVALRVIDPPVSFRVRGYGSHGGLSRYARSQEVFCLRCGDELHLKGDDSQWLTEVVVTNEAGVRALGTGWECSDKPGGNFILFHQYKNAYWRNKNMDTYRSFAIDIKRGVFYDIERKMSGNISFPFHALWRNWDAYRKNLTEKSHRLDMSPVESDVTGANAGAGDERKYRERIAERNRERRAMGLPDMSDRETRIYLRDESRTRHRRWIERMRQETTGRFVTTEEDAQMDLERVRLHGLYWHVARDYALSVGRPGERPTDLRELLVCRNALSGRDLLEDGENDIRDVWGHEYRYHFGQGGKLKMVPDHVVLTSAGPDGVFDTADDISSDDWFAFRKFELERTGKK